MSKGKILHLLFGIFGNATGLFLFLCPVVTLKRVIKKRSTEDFSGIPYVMALLNCLLSAWYGLPLITKNNYLVTVVNGTGAALELSYVLIFITFAPKKEKAKIFGLLLLVLSAFSAIALASILGFSPGKKRQTLCGVAAAVFSILMYAAPLSIMRMVIKTKSVEYMPFLLSLFCFLCGTSWFIYGLIALDLFLYIPNGFGCLLGAMQLILYTIYRKNKTDPDKNKPNGNGSLEMGLAKPSDQR